MILQSAFQNDRDKVYASQEEINAVNERYAQGQTTEIQQPEAGFFEGMGEAWKGLPAGALKSASLLEEVAANTGLSHINPDRLEQEDAVGGFSIEDTEKHQAILRSRLESDAKAHREEADGRFGIKPETVGMAGQILYGLAETLPKAVTASAIAGPYGGAALFGAEYGGTQYLELRDKGVDQKTAAIAGAVSGFTGAVGVAIPATFGQTRIASATIGALANAGLTGVELGTVGWILENQNYDDLAEQYGLNATSLITSGAFGALLGGGMWRPRARAVEKAEPKKQPKPNNEQVAAGRVVLQSSTASARIQKLLKKDPNKLTAKDARDMQNALRASDIAVQQMSNGQAVDVANVIGDAEIDESVMKESRGNFAREYLMGGDDSQAVVLQNRDRDTVASVGQMNRIAAKPDYQLASFSRMLQDGAPIVSFGTMPDNAHLGKGDLVVGPNNRRIPVQYAVVEADSVLTSNDYLGNANPSYGDASKVNAVAGNGRATGIAEAYNRGTAEQYKADMIADAQHGIDPEVIKAMKKPMLVRFIGKNEVTTKLIEESNKQSTLARSPVELAVDDAKLISRNVDSYEFDEDGLPTEATVQQFVNDINEPNALGRLITRDGNVTPEAVARVQNAVVQAAYGDLAFSELVAMETKPGAKRLMNALVKAAPKFVEVRKTLGESYDFSHLLLEGFKKVRESMRAGQDSVLQSGSIFGDNSASAFIDMLDRNRNSMAGVMRELDLIFDAIKQAQESAGGMFGGEMMDLPEILSRVRQAQNEARLAEGKPLLMDIDAEEMRQGLKAAQELKEAVEAQARALEAQQVADTQAVDPVERSRQMLTENADAVRVAELAEEMPDMPFKIEGDNGQEVELSIAEIMKLNEADLARAETEAISMGESFACVDLNRGI